MKERPMVAKVVAEAKAGNEQLMAKIRGGK
jgi:hypothetical protein